jgi:hypothetical protein
MQCDVLTPIFVHIDVRTLTPCSRAHDLQSSRRCAARADRMLSTAFDRDPVEHSAPGRDPIRHEVLAAVRDVVTVRAVRERFVPALFLFVPAFHVERGPSRRALRWFAARERTTTHDRKGESQRPRVFHRREVYAIGGSALTAYSEPRTPIRAEVRRSRGLAGAVHGRRGLVSMGAVAESGSASRSAQLLPAPAEPPVAYPGRIARRCLRTAHQQPRERGRIDFHRRGAGACHG